MESVTVHFSPDQDDLVRGSYLASLHLPGGRVQLAGAVMIGLCPLCGTAALSIATGHLRTDLLMAAMLVILVLVGLFYLLFVAYPVSRWKQMQKLGLTGAETRFELTDEYLHVAREDVYAKQAWITVKSCTESRAYYLISSHANRAYFYYIPKRAFESAEREAAFRAMVQAHLGPIRK